MKKRVLLGCATAIIIAGAIVMAQIRPSSEPALADIITDAKDNPFAGLDDIFKEGGVSSDLAGKELQDEGLSLRILPQVHSDETGTGFAGINIPYSECEKDPGIHSADYTDRVTGDGAALRAIYDYLRRESVLEMQDCTCAAKVTPLDEARQIRDALAREQGAEWKPLAVSEEYRRKSRELNTQVEAFCGGRI